MENANSFVLLRDDFIDEYRTRARLYRHVKTGAEVLSLENDDENKVFGATFRTPPPDSTGIAHILEHAVLGGSQKYPLKEPFVQLLKGSLKTFLNAMTYPDRTVYPVASTNLQDFYNLVDVYLDAVFFPLITENHLLQEGWHYELAAPDAPLTYKGVVFNESLSDAQVLGSDGKIHLLRGTSSSYRQVTSQSDWPSYNGGMNGSRYSQLAQITPANVARLAPKWIYSLNSARLQVTPVVVEGVMYVTSANEL